MMKEGKLSSQIEELLESLDSEAEVSQASQLLHKRFFERALKAELEDHLGYAKHANNSNSNSRNGTMSKRVYTEHGQLSIDTPRDREGSFEPQMIKKRQTRLPGLDSKIIYLYAQGLSTREITDTLEEMYSTEVSPALVSRVTDAILTDVIEWQSRPLDAIYPIVYLDGIVVKVRQDKHVINNQVKHNKPSVKSQCIV